MFANISTPCGNSVSSDHVTPSLLRAATLVICGSTGEAVKLRCLSNRPDNPARRAHAKPPHTTAASILPWPRSRFERLCWRAAPVATLLCAFAGHHGWTVDAYAVGIGGSCAHGRVGAGTWRYCDGTSHCGRCRGFADVLAARGPVALVVWRYPGETVVWNSGHASER